MNANDITGCGSYGIHELVHESIMACDADTRKHFYSNIVYTLKTLPVNYTRTKFVVLLSQDRHFLEH